MSLDPFVLTLLRFTFCVFPLIFFVRKPEGVSYSTLALYGALFGAGLWWVVNFAIHNGLSAGMSSVFLQFSAFFTIILSALLLKERVGGVHVVGMLISLSGLLLILLCSTEQSTLLGIFLVLLAALSWSLCNLIVKVSKPRDMPAFIIWSSLFSMPVIFVMTVVWKGLEPFNNLLGDMTLGAVFSILFQSFVTTIFGYMVWNNLMKKYPASVVAPLSLIVPVSGVVTSYIFFDERLSGYQMLALALVVVGIAVFVNSYRLQCYFDAKKSVRSQGL